VISRRSLATAGLAALWPLTAAGAGTSAAQPSGIAGLVLPAGCSQPRPCRPFAAPVFVQVARASTRTVVATVRLRDFRFRVATAPGTYLVRAVRSMSADAAGGRRVLVRTGAFTLVVLRA
jgi:hypothetical protein